MSIGGFATRQSLGAPRARHRTVYRDKVSYRDRVRTVTVKGKCAGDPAALAKAKARIAKLEALRDKLQSSRQTWIASTKKHKARVLEQRDIINRYIASRKKDRDRIKELKAQLARR